MGRLCVWKVVRFLVFVTDSVHLGLGWFNSVRIWLVVAAPCFSRVVVELQVANLGYCVRNRGY